MRGTSLGLSGFPGIPTSSTDQVFFRISEKIPKR
jgi:hypothetical protein